MKAADIVERYGRGIPVTVVSRMIVDVCAYMRSGKVPGVVVLSERGEIRGVLSQRDIILAAGRIGSSVMQMTAGDLSNDLAAACEADTSAFDVLELVNKTNSEFVLVTQEGVIQGIITATDIIDVVLSQFTEVEPVLAGLEADGPSAQEDTSEEQAIEDLPEVAEAEETVQEVAPEVSMDAPYEAVAEEQENDLGVDELTLVESAEDETVTAPAISEDQDDLPADSQLIDQATDQIEVSVQADEEAALEPAQDLSPAEPVQLVDETEPSKSAEPVEALQQQENAAHPDDIIEREESALESVEQVVDSVVAQEFEEAVAADTEPVAVTPALEAMPNPAPAISEPAVPEVPSAAEFTQPATPQPAAQEESSSPPSFEELQAAIMRASEKAAAARRERLAKPAGSGSSGVQAALDKHAVAKFVMG